ncbi:MAG: myo-inositol catabolism protein IolH [Opitutaceae bacterium]|nr:myo-inositol catabolism protein IolH [Opitutaceae bacterium]|tara:strand:+ start:544 stop:1431 length:888 start_codon:yes stop_codon:yes gene_type:complete
MPQLAVFPKAYMQELVKDGTMSLQQWVDLAAPLGVDGLEYYSGMLELVDRSNWAAARKQVEDVGMVIPMLCCSPDFSQPDPELRKQEIENEKNWIRMSAELGASYCRVLSGQQRPELIQEEGLNIIVENIEACLPEAEKCGVTLILENHYKDDFWEYPEFAQKMDVFCELISRIEHLHFGVNYDPSNAFLAGDDPLELLDRVKHRVVTMHASDRYLLSGTLEDLRNEEGGALGYAKRLAHGEIGKGLNDYDAILGTLKNEGFDSWISIEDGVDGMDQLAASVKFVRDKIAQHWPE